MDHVGLFKGPGRGQTRPGIAHVLFRFRNHLVTEFEEKKKKVKLVNKEEDEEGFYK